MEDTLIKRAEVIRRSIRRLYKWLDRDIDEQARAGGMTLPQTRVIEVLYNTPGASQKEIAHELDMAHSTISGILDRLLAMNLINREQDENDRRITRYTLVEHVKSYIETQTPTQLATPVARVLLRATKDELQAIEKGIATLIRLYEADSEAGAGKK